MLLPSQVRPFLVHEDRFVRDAVIRYFADSHSRDETLIPDILRLSELHGGKVNACGLNACHHFPVNEEGLVGLLKRLERVGQDHDWSLNLAIAQAPLELLDQYDTAIQHHPGITAGTRTRLKHRRRFATHSAEQLWNRLQGFAHESDKHEYASELDSDYLESLILELAAHEVPDTPTICRLLQEAEEQDGAGYLEVFLVSLAGERRLQPVVPLLVNKLCIDSDYLLEEALLALCKIGDPQTARAIQEIFPAQSWSFKNYASSVLRGIKCRESEEAILALLESEQDIDIRTLLCDGLCDLFSQQGIEVVCRQIQAGYDQTWATLEEQLLPVLDVLDIDLSEAARWRKEREDTAGRLARRRRQLDLAARMPLMPEAEQGLTASPIYRRPEQKVGRNDRCPCGSGKKYKKCCGRK